VDGAARGNPGPAAYGVYAETPEGEPIEEMCAFLGRATNNVAEYKGLLAALEWAVAEGVEELEVRTDSLLMASQMKGKWKVKNAVLRGLHLEARAMVGELRGFAIRHVPREENRKADRLANRALDEAFRRKREPSRNHPGGEGRA
jgi:ribonuclease HI